MGKNIWWVTRPTRDLHDIEYALKSFAEIAQGQKWKGNRQLHKKFEVNNPAKTSNVGQHGGEGSGGRTWAAWLKMWGLWYNDDCVTLTDAGEMIVSTKDPQDIHKQIVHLIMTFQITSAYHKKLKYTPEFQIFPFRLILRLLLNPKIEYLKTDEISLFLLQVKKPDEYTDVVDKILTWRKQTKDKDKHKKMKDKLLQQHRKKYDNPRSDSPEGINEYWRSIRDVGNTLMINISYIDEIIYDKQNSSVSIRKDSIDEAAELLAKYQDMPFSKRYEFSEHAFTRKFGIRYDRRKASKKDTVPMTSAKKRHKRIMNAIDELKKKGGMTTGSDLVTKIHKITHDPGEEIEKIISEELDLDQIDQEDEEFVQYYLQCAKDGEEHAEFENMTRKIFAMMGFETKKHKIHKNGKGNPEIDGLVLNKDTNMSGLLECKSGAKYTFPLGDCAKMQNLYIKSFEKKQIDKTIYTLDFFVYVIGQKASGLDNFNDIINKTKVRGAVIYAKDLIRIYCLLKQNKITAIKVWGLFKSNKHLTWKDIDVIIDT